MLFRSTPSSITTEFINFFNEDTQTILISSLGYDEDSFHLSNTYKNSTVGVDYLFNKSYTCCDITDLKEYTRKKHKLILLLNILKHNVKVGSHNHSYKIYDAYLFLIKEFPDHRICYITHGSPYYRDLICRDLIESQIISIKVIDTLSSVDLSISELKSKNKLPAMKIAPIELYNYDLIEDHINVYSSISSFYQHNVDKLIQKITNDYVVYLIKLGYKTDIEQIDGEELACMLETPVLRSTLDDKTVVVHRRIE